MRSRCKQQVNETLARIKGSYIVEWEGEALSLFILPQILHSVLGTSLPERLINGGESQRRATSGLRDWKHLTHEKRLKQEKLSKLGQSSPNIGHV